MMIAKVYNIHYKLHKLKAEHIWDKWSAFYFEIRGAGVPMILASLLRRMVFLLIARYIEYSMLQIILFYLV